jgi:hypothetical protein
MTYLCLSKRPEYKAPTINCSNMPQRKLRKNHPKRGTKALVVTPRNFGGGMPPRYRTTLTYQQQVTLNNAGSTFANLRYTPSYAYDVNPVPASTAMPFFSELGAIYRFCRVDKATLIAQMGNNEAFNVVAYVLPMNFDPGANSVSYQNYLSNPLTKRCMLGPLTGNNKGRLRVTAKTSTFAGVRNTNQTDFYSAGTTGASAPSNLWYLVLGVEAANNFISGVLVDAVLKVECEFYELATPST